MLSPPAVHYWLVDLLWSLVAAVTRKCSMPGRSDGDVAAGCFQGSAARGELTLALGCAGALFSWLESTLNSAHRKSRR